MKKRFTKSLVAMLALIAMLTQNAYYVYASGTGIEPTEGAETTPQIVVETEEVTPSDEEVIEETSEIQTEEQSDYQDETSSDEQADYSEEEAPVEEIPVEETSSVPETLDVLETQISGSGLDSLEVYIDTNRLNTGDTFRIVFTGPSDARYDTRLNDNLDTNAQGVYRFLDLNNEGFNIRATSDDNVTFEFGYEDGKPAIKVISVDSNVDKMLYTKSIQTRDGKPASAVYGEGYTNISVAIDTEKLSDKASYTVFVDTEADVTINGSQIYSFKGSKATKNVDLSNLDKKSFTLYIVENEGSEVTADASVVSAEDGEVKFYVSGEEERTKRVYTYSDADVSVTATLQYANAVPDDAEFVVTPIKSSAAVKAYIDALNNANDGMNYSQENTLLYDIAFLVDKTDEDGNVIPGEKVEFEPEVGSVSIDIKFIQSQITDELGVDDSENVIVNHLPLKESVKDAVDTTVDATDIDASDVIVEPVNADVSVKEDGTDEIKLSVDSLSVFGVTGGSEIKPGTSVTYDSVLGKAKNYGIVANQMTLDGHLESNFAVGAMHGNAQINGPKNDGKSAGTTYIGSYDGSDFKMALNGNSGTLLIYTTYNAVKNFGNNMTGYPSGTFGSTPRYPENVSVDITKYSESEIKNMVSGIISNVNTQSVALMGEKTAIAYSTLSKDGANYPILDIAGKNSTAGTYYLNFKEGEYTGQHFVIKINSDQNVVFNIPDTSVSFGQYEIYIDGKKYTTNGNSDEDVVCQRVIFNCPNATYAAANGNCSGTFLVPKADFYTNATSAGWLVCNNAKKIGGQEWHCVYHDMPDPIYNPTSLQFKVEKQLKNLADGDEKEAFKFVLYETKSNYYTNAGNNPTKLGEVTVSSYDENNSGLAFFPEIEYSEAKTYYYVIKEEMQGNQSVNWMADNGIYAHIKVVVGKRTEGNVTTYTVDSVEYSYGLNSSRALDNPVSLDKNNAKVTFINTKHKLDTGLELPVKKTLKNSKDEEIVTWPIDETFYFKIEPMTNAEVNPGSYVTENPPKPIQNLISVNNANREAKFIWADNAFVYSETTTPGVGGMQTLYGNDGVITYKYPMCYMYKIYEVIPENKTPGVTYDEHEQYVKVWVNSCKNSTGKKWVEVSVNGSKSLHYCEGTLNRVDFVNKYEQPKGAIKVTKVVKAGNIDYETTDKFYFIVKKGEDQVGGIYEISAKQTITISDLPVGVYSVIETDSQGNPVSKSDSFKYESTVTPVSVGVVAGQTADTIPLTTITNKVDILPTSITIDGSKKVDVTQYSINNSDFEFTLEASPANAPMPAGSSSGKLTVANEGEHFNFGTINYTKDDIGKTYTYTVTESKINKNGFAENNERYTVTVKVTQSGNQVAVEKTIKKGSTDVTASGIKFTNKFTASIPLSFEAKKQISGRNLSAQEFSFVLEATNENAIAKMPTGAVNGRLTRKNEASNTNEDIISFGGVEFTQNDLGKTFTYRITEPGNDGNGLVFDKAIYDITVTPKLNENNAMYLEKTVNKTVNSQTTDASGYVKADGNICVLFNNVYTTDGKVSFSFTKVVEGAVPDTASFKFNLYQMANAQDKNGTLVGYTTVTGPFPKAVEFKDIDALKFDTKDVGKTFYFYAVEEIPAGATKNANNEYVLNGIVYSTVRHEFTVSVKDLGNGKLGFDITKDGTKYEVGATLGEFVNKYTVASVEVPVSGKKSLPGKEIKKDDYSFKIEAVSAVDAAGTAINDIPMPANDVTTVQNAEGNFSFGRIEFTKAGTYTYRVTEIEPTEGKQAGVTYDKDSYTVIIKIKDDRNGNLVQDGRTVIKRNDSTEIESLDIKNTYEAEGTVVLEAKKTVNDGNYTVKAGSFVFGIYTNDQGTKLINPKNSKSYTAVNDGSGNVTFDEIKYSYDDVKDAPNKSVTYTYYIHELSTEDEINDYDGDKNVALLDGYTYDTSYYPVTVTVSDDGTGKLKVEKSYAANTNNEIVVKNRYDAEGSTDIYGIKTLKGRSFAADDKFEFVLIANDSNDPNVAYEGNVVDKVEISGSQANSDGKIEFKFNNNLEHTLQYTATGTYYYTVKEVIPAKRDANIVYDTVEYTVKVIVSDNGDGTLNAVPDKGTLNVPVEFTNKVPTAEGADFEAYKVLTGRDLNADEFEFTLGEVAADGSVTKLQTKSNAAAKAGDSARVSFDGIRYEMKDAGEHVYEIAEVIPSKAEAVEMEINGQTVTKYVYKGVTYDDTKFYAVVNVSVDATGDKVVVNGPVYHIGSKTGATVDAASVKFNNKYAGKTSAYFEGEKHLYRNKVYNGVLLIGDREIDIPDNMKFSFVLKDANGTVLQTVQNNGKKFEFAPIEYTAEDLKDENKIGDNQYMIRYTIEEVSGTKNIGVTYDDKIYDCAVVLSVAKNGDLKAQKRVVERTTDDAANEGPWDRLKNWVSGNSDGIRFNNVYSAKGKIKLGVTKTLTGMEWGDATSFDFEIVEGANIVTQTYYGYNETVTVTKDSPNHTAYFTDLEFDIDDLYSGTHSGSREFTFKIKEIKPSNPIPGVTYDTDTRTVDINVVDNHDGTLGITVEIDGVAVDANVSEQEGILVSEPSPIGITNVYKPTDTVAQVKGKKVLTGKTLEEGEFSFAIAAVTENAPLPEALVVTNKADGTFEFGEMAYTSDMLLGSNGVYAPSKDFVYTVTEIIPADAETITVDGKEYKKKGNITYDATPRTVTVTVENVAGELKATVSPDEVGLQFTNSYDKEDEISLAVKKSVVGTSATDKQFTFTLKSITESDPNRGSETGDEVLIDSAVAVNGETVSFKALKFTLQGVLADAKKQNRNDKTAVYKYTIEEAQNAVEGYAISKQRYEVTVTVSASDAGALTITKNVVETVDRYGDAIASPTAAIGDLAEFTNEYSAEGYTDISIVKTLKGRDIKEGEFTFYLKDEDGAILETETSVYAKATDKKATNTFTFGGENSNLHYTVDSLKNGESYDSNKILYYTIEEKIPEDLENSAVTYDTAVYVVAVFINNPGEGSLQVDRVSKRFLSDRSAAISSMKQFINMNWDNSKSFAKNVESLKSSSETIEFVNEYDANGKWDPRGKKVLTGMPLEKDKLFKFTLNEYEVKDTKATSKVINTAEGYNGGVNHEQIIFDEANTEFLKYDLDDVGLHIYKITEVLPVKADKDGKVVKDGITYDTKEWTFHVTVTDKGDGTLDVKCNESTETGDVLFTFNNHYNAEGYIDLYGAKVLEGTDFENVNPFEFSIKEITNGQNGTEYKVNNVDGKITFDHTQIPVLNYSITDDDRSAVGEHVYEVRETSKSGNGITCDTRVYTVTVLVTDNADGTLDTKVKSVTYPLNDGAGVGSYDISTDKEAVSFSFTNKYDASAQILFKGVKHIRNAELSTVDIVKAADLAGKYNFAVYEYKSAEDRANGVAGKQVGTTTSCDGEGKYTLYGPKFTQDDLKETESGKTGYKASAEFFYQIVELKPSAGEWDSTKTIFTGMNGVQYDNRVYNVDVTVKAAAKGSDKLLVEVKDHDTNETITASADADNVYSVGDTAAQRASRAEGIGYFDFKNIKREYTRVAGTKTWNDGDQDPKTRPDVYIDLMSSEDNYATVIDTYVIKAPGTEYAFEKLPATDKFGKIIEYKVSERPIEGYYSEQVGYDFYNTKGDVLIRKVNADSKDPLPGAELVILDSTGKEVARWITSTSAYKVDARLTPGATYTLHEVTPPAGYLSASDMTFIAPAKGGDIVVTMEDPKICGNVRLRKLDSATREALAGAEFALYTEDGERVYATGVAGSYEYSTTSSNARFAVNASGELEIRDLPYGTYYFTELTAPSGYALSSERVGFTILENDATVEVTFLNTKLTGSVRLRKTNADGSVPLAGAVFELYAKTPTSASAAIASTIYSDVYYRVGTYTTDASGSIYVGDLPWDDYYFVEVTAPSGYEVTKDVNGDDIAYTFTVGATGTTELTYDLGRITNSTSGGEVRGGRRGGEVRGERRDDGTRNGGVLSGVLGVRAAPKQGVLGERLGPVTGDATNIILWLVLLLASIGAIVGVAVVNSKRKKAVK